MSWIEDLKKTYLQSQTNLENAEHELSKLLKELVEKIQNEGIPHQTINYGDGTLFTLSVKTPNGGLFILDCRPPNVIHVLGRGRSKSTLDTPYGTLYDFKLYEDLYLASQASKKQNELRGVENRIEMVRKAVES